jgi:hypothetical protein
MNKTKNKTTASGYAYLSPNISVPNSKSVRKTKPTQSGAGQTIGSTRPTKSTYLSPRLTEPLYYT